METAAAARPRRNPLQPLNSLPSPTAGTNAKPKRANTTMPATAKMNRPVVAAGPREASLADELEVIRRRNERLCLDRKRTEAVLRARDEVLERGIQEFERRWVEQKQMEMGVIRLARLQDIGSPVSSTPFQSLRSRELENRRIESSPLPVVENMNKAKLKEENAQLSSVMDKELALIHYTYGLL